MIGAGLADSCAACHSRPFGSAGFGGNVFTKPDSRDTPHLFGIGLKEMIADEMTASLRAIRAAAIATAQQQQQQQVTQPLVAKTVSFGSITAFPNGQVDTSQVDGVDIDLRVKPFAYNGGTTTIREFIIGAFDGEQGLEAFDPDTLQASHGQDVLTPAGMLLSGTQDFVAAPPAGSASADPDNDGVTDELPVSVLDHLEMYLLNVDKPARGRQNSQTLAGLARFQQLGCAVCHVPDYIIDRDRRVVTSETVHAPAQANNVFSQLFATVRGQFDVVADGSGFSPFLRPRLGTFRVRGIYTDFKRHDLGAGYHERNFDGSVTTEFLTIPLWGVGSTAPYGHDGRSLTLEDAILRHGGEALASRNAFAALQAPDQTDVIVFLQSLLLFSPPNTPSNLAPVQPNDPFFPQQGHGSIDLSAFFVVPSDKE